MSTLVHLDDIMTRINSMQANVRANPKTSSSYALVPTQGLIDRVDHVLNASGLEVAKVKLLAQRRGLGSTHAIEYTLEQTLSIQGDNIKPRIVVINSFNGEKALTVLCGMFRLVCSNGLVVGTSLYRERAIHTQGETLDNKLAGLESNVQNALTWIRNSMGDSISEFLAIPTPIEAQERIVRGLKLSNKLTDTLIHQFNNPRSLRISDQAGNAWSTYNVINEAIARSSRSELAILNKNISLMDNVRDLALSLN